MVGAVLSILNQLLKFILEDHETVIHTEGSNLSYPGFSSLVIKDSFKITDFHMVEIMNVTFEDTTPQVPMSLVYEMFATTMLRSGFETDCGLGKNLDGIYASLPIPLQNFHFFISYTPT